MPTFERAERVQRYMGGDIYYDKRHRCYRVMQCDSPSLWRDGNNYERIGK